MTTNEASGIKIGVLVQRLGRTDEGIGVVSAESEKAWGVTWFVADPALYFNHDEPKCNYYIYKDGSNWDLITVLGVANS